MKMRQPTPAELKSLTYTHYVCAYGDFIANEIIHSDYRTDIDFGQGISVVVTYGTDDKGVNKIVVRLVVDGVLNKVAVPPKYNAEWDEAFLNDNEEHSVHTAVSGVLGVYCIENRLKQTRMELTREVASVNALDGDIVLW